MFETMKDLFAFGYRAAEIMEEKSKTFREERKGRMDDFREESKRRVGELRERADERSKDIRKSVKDEVGHLIEDAGFATKKELDEVKAMLEEIKQKLG